MKILFFSDVHGCSEPLEALTAHIDELEADAAVMLGDALYHGPRNPLREDYAPQTAVTLLNSMKTKIIAVRGNCDCEVDQMLLEFPMTAPCAHLLADGRRFFLTHGHSITPDAPPALPPGSVFAYGHTHIMQLEKHGNLILFNPGSVSLPKGGNPATFGFFDGAELTVRELKNGNILTGMKL